MHIQAAISVWSPWRTVSPRRSHLAGFSTRHPSGHLEELIGRFKHPLFAAAFAPQWQDILAILEGQLPNGRWSDQEKEEVWEFLREEFAKQTEASSVACLGFAVGIVSSCLQWRFFFQLSSRLVSCLVYRKVMIILKNIQEQPSTINNICAQSFFGPGHVCRVYERLLCCRRVAV